MIAMAVHMRAVYDSARVAQHDRVLDGSLDVLTPPAAVGRASSVASTILSDTLDENQPSFAPFKNGIANSCRAKVPTVSIGTHAPIC